MIKTKVNGKSPEIQWKHLSEHPDNTLLTDLSGQIYLIHDNYLISFGTSDDIHIYDFAKIKSFQNYFKVFDGKITLENI